MIDKKMLAAHCQAQNAHFTRTAYNKHTLIFSVYSIFWDKIIIHNYV